MIQFALLAFLTLTLFAPGSVLAKSSVFLEVTDSGSSQCESDHTGAAIQTAVEISDGEPGTFIVYLLAQADASPPFLGLAGLQMAVTYTESNGIDRGLEILSWNLCGVLEFPQAEWPASGYGNTITYLTGGTSNCSSQGVVVGGYFEVEALGPAFMSIAPYGPTGLVMIANCAIRDEIIDIPVDKRAHGWVAFNTGDTDPETGCNPLVEDCAGAPTPIEATTWSRVKMQFAD